MNVHFRGTLRALLLSCTLILAGFALPLRAFAHALLMHSTRAPHATLHDHTPAIELHFNSRIDDPRSRLTLTTAADTSGKQPLSLTPYVQSAPDTLVSVPAAPLPPGAYALHWIVLASDGHISRGEIPFTIA